MIKAKLDHFTSQCELSMIVWRAVSLLLYYWRSLFIRRKLHPMLWNLDAELLDTLHDSLTRYSTNTVSPRSFGNGLFLHPTFQFPVDLYKGSHMSNSLILTLSETIRGHHDSLDKHDQRLWASHIEIFWAIDWRICHAYLLLLPLGFSELLIKFRFHFFIIITKVGSSVPQHSGLKNLVKANLDSWSP